MGPRGSLCRQGGFSLLEMVVVLAVVGVSLFLAAGLLQEAQTLISATGAELTSPVAGLASDRLRTDLQASEPVGPFPPSLLFGWSTEPLSLRRAGGSSIVYERDGRKLLRRLLDEEGTEAGVEILLRDVVQWRWRASAPNLVEIDLAYHRASPASRWRLDGGPGKPAPELAVERLLLALRGGGRERGW